MAENSTIERIGDRIIFVAERILALGLIAGISLDFINVVGRYTGGFSVLGIDEIEIYILIWIAFVGAVAITWRQLHLRMDILTGSFSLPVRRIIWAFETLVMLVVTAFVGVQSFFYVSKVFALGSISDIVGLPMWIPHSAVCLSFFAISAIVLVRGVERLRMSNPGPETKL